MGIKDLTKFLTNHIPDTSGIRNVNTCVLENKVIAIDISIFLYQYACAIKNNSSSDLVNKDGEVITHVQAIVTKALGLIKKKIKPIFVFDGSAPIQKNHTLEGRNKTKKQAKEKIKNFNIQINDLYQSMISTPTTIDELDDQQLKMDQITELKKKKLTASKQTTHISKKQMTECKEILELFGIPVVQAPSEADPQCVHLTSRNIAYGVATEDMDILTFGAKHLIRKLSSSSQCIIYDFDTIISDLGFTHDQFIDACILLGCDYTGTIKGLGLRKIYNAIKTYGNIEKILTANPKMSAEDCDYVVARQCFKHPDVIEVENIKWKITKYNELSQLLKEKYSYNHDEVDKLFNVLHGGYYSVICGEKTIKQYKRDCTAYIKQKELNMMDSDED
mgnify:CR=1 FL=1